MKTWMSLLTSIVISAGCVAPQPGAAGPTGAARGSRDPSDLQTAEAILREVEARQWDGEVRHTITTDLAKERAALAQSKADLAAIRPTFETTVWNEPAAKAKVELRARWRAEESYVGAADGYLALLEAKAAAEASPTEANLAALRAVIDPAKRAVWRDHAHEEVDGFFRGTVTEVANAATAWLASTPSLESTARRGAAVATQVPLSGTGVTNVQLTIADERVGALFVLAAGQLTTVKLRLVDPAGTSKHGLVECPPSATDADRCSPIERINGTAEIAVQNSRELRVRGPKGPVHVQVFAKDAKYPLSALAVGAPAGNAGIPERDLHRWGLNQLTLASDLKWRDALDLFTRVPGTFVVYATSEVAVSYSGSPRPKVMPGEPLLMLGSALLRANGELVTVNYTDAERRLLQSSGKHTLEGVVTPERSRPLALPAARPASEPKLHVLEHLTDADVWEFNGVDDKRVAAYLAARKPVVACIDSERRKQGSGSGLDLVTYDASGKVKSVKSLSSVLNGRIETACKVAGLVAKREALRKALRGEALQAIRTHVAK